MTIKSGTRLGPYEITGSIGAGGMGQVYRARDTRLDRTVAIKVLPPDLASAPEFRERFDREARAIAALNHPHICTLHDVGQQDAIDYLVLEYLKGETLAERLTRGPLPLEQTLQLGEQIADALARAHRAGIVHRDLKPGNIMLTASGAKLLDFGLAKASPTGAVPASATMLPTTPPNLTMQGMLLGTSHYMAPEQVEGNEADARSDIFAFGVVLYEMLTGTRPFTGKSLAHLHAAILEHEPEPLAIRLPAASPALVRTVSKCLAKNPDDRWQSASDLRDELRWIAQHGAAPAATAQDTRAPSRLRSAWMAWMTAAILGMAAMALAVTVLLRPDPDVREYDAEIVPPAPLAGPASGRLALSPDGRSLAFTAPSAQGDIILWVRDLASGDTRAIPGTDGASSPFWSPDSRTIGFASTTNRGIMQVDAAGGPVTFLYRPSTTHLLGFAGGTWNADNVIVFAPNGGTSPLYRITANQRNAEAAILTEIDEGAGETGHVHPMFLPDQRRFLYLAGDASGPRAVFVGSLDSSERVHLLNDVVDVQYAAGHLFFVRGTSLLAQRFDVDTLTFSEQPRTVAGGVLVGAPPTVGAAFSASTTGELVYQAGAATTASRLVWMDRVGQVTNVVAETAQYADLMMSYDGRFASFSKADGTTSSTRDDWIIDLATGHQRQLTVDPGNELEAVWSFGGDKLIYNSDRRGQLNLYIKSASGAGAEEEILVDSINKYPQSWSPNGEFVIYMTLGKQTGQDLWLLPMRTRKPEPLLVTSVDESIGQFSPDGRWIVYQSRGHIWVMPFRRPGGPWQISTEAGGTFPRWTRGGREVLYLRTNAVMSATVNCAADTCEVAGVRRLFERHYEGPTRWSYAVAPDGNRILALITEKESSVGTIKLKVNWPARLADRSESLRTTAARVTGTAPGSPGAFRVRTADRPSRQSE